MKRLLLSFLVLVAPRAFACGTTDVCSDVYSTFNGQVITDGVRLTWSTDSEAAPVAYYRLVRYDCGDPSCATVVATISRTGTCGPVESYSRDDNPPDPDNGWTYSLEVFTAGNARVCAADWHQ